MKEIKTPLAVIQRELYERKPKEYRYSIYTRHGNLVDLQEDTVLAIHDVISKMFKKSPLEQAPELRNRFPY